MNFYLYQTCVCATYGMNDNIEYNHVSNIDKPSYLSFYQFNTNHNDQSVSMLVSHHWNIARYKLVYQKCENPGLCEKPAKTYENYLVYAKLNLRNVF